MNIPTFFDPWVESEQTINVSITGLVYASNISRSLKKYLLEAYGSNWGPQEKIVAKKSKKGKQSNSREIPKYHDYWRDGVPLSSDYAVRLSNADMKRIVTRPFTGDGRDFVSLVRTIWYVANSRRREYAFGITVSPEKPFITYDQSNDDEPDTKEILSRLVQKTMFSKCQKIWVLPQRTEVSAREMMAFGSKVAEIDKITRENSQCEKKSKHASKRSS